MTRLETAEFQPGNYKYVRGPFQYSAGVAALPGYAIERVRFRAPVPLTQGFSYIETHLKSIGRPLTAFCACELRSPAPFTEQGFIDFNRVYVGTLEKWGLFKNEENPVARSNVCPEVHKPGEPGFHAFSYTVPAGQMAGGFVIAGSGEAPEGKGSYQERIIRLGDTSPDAMAEKAAYVLDTMEKRMAALDMGWADSTATQVYCVHEIHSLMAEAFEAIGASALGLTWHFARPPVEGLDFEVDTRGVSLERVAG